MNEKFHRFTPDGAVCYNLPVKDGDSMKSNTESVKDYQKKMSEIKIRFVGANEELGIPDYKEIFKQQAEILGKKSVTDYILDLLERDIQENGLKDKDFSIVRGVKASKK